MSLQPGRNITKSTTKEKILTKLEVHNLVRDMNQSNDDASILIDLASIFIESVSTLLDVLGLQMSYRTRQIEKAVSNRQEWFDDRLNEMLTHDHQRIRIREHYDYVVYVADEGFVAYEGWALNMDKTPFTTGIQLADGTWRYS